MRTLHVGFSCLLGLSAVASGQQDSAEFPVGPIMAMPKFANEPGWSWSIEPSPFHLGPFGGASETILWTGYSVVDADGVLRIFAARAAVPGILDPPARVVVFDAAGKRYLPEPEQAGGVGNRGTDLKRNLSSLDPKVLAPDKIAYMGIERRGGPRVPPAIGPNPNEPK